jgi:ankyrin repeat protein
MSSTTIIRKLREINEISNLADMKSSIIDLIQELEVKPAVFPKSTSANAQTIGAWKSSLASAVANSDIDGVRSSLSEAGIGFDISTVPFDEALGVSVLHKAVEKGNTLVLQILFRHMNERASSSIFLHKLAGDMLRRKLKSEFNHKTKIDGFTPLHFALMSSVETSDQIILDLLKHGADPDVASASGVTPFLMACELGEAEAVSLMLQSCNGSCIHTKDAEGNTCLHLAAENGHEELLGRLMTTLPSLEQELNDKGESAMDLAIENGHEEIAELLAQLAQRSKSVDSGDGFVFG